MSANIKVVTWSISQIDRKIKWYQVTRDRHKQSDEASFPATCGPCDDAASCHIMDTGVKQDNLIRRMWSQPSVKRQVELAESSRVLWGASAASVARSVFEGSTAAGSAEEILQQVSVHLPESSRLCHPSQVIHTEFKAELLQVLWYKRGGKRFNIYLFSFTWEGLINKVWMNFYNIFSEAWGSSF